VHATPLPVEHIATKQAEEFPAVLGPSLVFEGSGEAQVRLRRSLLGVNVRDRCLEEELDIRCGSIWQW